MKHKDLVVFGKLVRDIRISKNLTQFELANLGQFDRNYIGMLERGERNPTLLTLIRLAKALNIPLHSLINFQQE